MRARGESRSDRASDGVPEDWVSKARRPRLAGAHECGVAKFCRAQVIESFFFEKKNQKTYVPFAQHRIHLGGPAIPGKEQKFFASFFQKRRPSPYPVRLRNTRRAIAARATTATAPILANFKNTADAMANMPSFCSTTTPSSPARPYLAT